MSGEVVHFEIPHDNAERARKFYAAVFGWKMNAMPEMGYTLVSTTESDQDGRPKEIGSINGGMGNRKAPLDHPTVTIAVDEIDVALKAIEKHGGKTLQKKTPIGDGSMGFTGYFKDSEGNVIGLWQMGSG
jgi:predicted enzyme related to lactoylglutathione lyase